MADDELAALRAQVELLRGEIALMRQERAAHACPPAPPQTWYQFARAAAGAAARPMVVEIPPGQDFYQSAMAGAGCAAGAAGYSYVIGG